MDTTETHIDGGKKRPWYKRFTMVGVALLAGGKSALDLAELTGHVPPGTGQATETAVKTLMDLVQTSGLAAIVVGIYRHLAKK